MYPETKIVFPKLEGLPNAKQLVEFIHDIYENKTKKAYLVFDIVKSEL